MKDLLIQMKWQFIILAKNNLITISVVVTVLYSLIFFGIKDLGNLEKALTLLIYNDPAIIGLLFIGLSIIMEKNQRVLSALFVTPLQHHIYLLSRILTLSFLGWACAMGMALAVLGTSFHFIHFSFGVFGTCVMFSLMGILIVSYTSEFLLFLLKSIPVLLFFSLPLLNYFELTNIGIFYLMPIQGCLNLIIHSYNDSPSDSAIIYGYASLVFWIPLFYYIVYRIFISKIVQAS